MLRKHLGFALNLAAIGLFFPGILLPIFSLNMEMAAELSGSTLTTPLIDKELSILATVEELWNDQRHLVALLIFLFSVGIPLIKTSLVTLAYLVKRQHRAKGLMRFVSAIGKWSMADVFVVAIFLAMLSTNHAQTGANHRFSIFGLQISLDISTETLSAAGPGFYYFAGYCVLSLLGSQLLFSGLKKGHT